MQSEMVPSYLGRTEPFLTIKSIAFVAVEITLMLAVAAMMMAVCVCGVCERLEIAF